MKQLLEQLGFKDDKGVYLPMLSEFVTDYCTWNNHAEYANNIVEYKNFITQPLKKEMFIPCLDGEVLSKPKQYEGALELDYGKDHERAMIYQQALEKVLFDGWNLSCTELLDKTGVVYSFAKDKDSITFNPKWVSVNGNFIKTIEQAINNGVKLYLK